MAPTALFGCLLLTIIAAVQGTKCPVTEDPSKQIICYYEGATEIDQINLCNCTHLVFTNAVTVEGYNITLNANQKINEKTALDAKDLRLVFSVNLSPEETAAVLKSEEKKISLLNSISTVLTTSEFTGVELHFEFSGKDGAKKEDLTSFVKDLRGLISHHRVKRSGYSVFEDNSNDFTTGRYVTEKYQSLKSSTTKKRLVKKKKSRIPREDKNVDFYDDDEAELEASDGEEEEPLLKRTKRRKQRVDEDGELKDGPENSDDFLILLRLSVRPEVIAKKYDLKMLAKYVDFLVVPTHVITDESEEGLTYHPSRLMGYSDMLNTDSLLDLLTGLGAPKEKMIVSMPAGVFQHELKDAAQNTVRSPTVGNVKEISQGKMCSLLRTGNWTVERDEDLTAPYAFSKTTWLAFEDEISVNIKAKYIILRDLAGAAVFPIDSDTYSDSCVRKEGGRITAALQSNFGGLARKPRQAILASLQEQIHDTATFSQEAGVHLSEYRIVRVVDHSGAVHVIRKNTKTEFECSRQGYFSHPLGCNKFYRCVKFNQYTEDYTVFEYDCPAGLAFDERWEVCVWPGSLPNGAPCTGSSEIAPVPRAVYQCPNAEGYYADPENCRWFFACLDHARDGISPLTAYEFRCPFGLVFDENTLVCDWPWKVGGCGARGLAGTVVTRLNGASAYRADATLINAGERASFATVPDYVISGGRIANKAGGVVLNQHIVGGLAGPVGIYQQSGVLVDKVPAGTFVSPVTPSSILVDDGGSSHRSQGGAFVSVSPSSLLVDNGGASHRSHGAAVISSVTPSSFLVEDGGASHRSHGGAYASVSPSSYLVHDNGAAHLSQGAAIVSSVTPSSLLVDDGGASHRSQGGAYISVSPSSFLVDDGGASHRSQGASYVSSVTPSSLIVDDGGANHRSHGAAFVTATPATYVATATPASVLLNKGAQSYYSQNAYYGGSVPATLVSSDIAAKYQSGVSAKPTFLQEVYSVGKIDAGEGYRYDKPSIGFSLPTKNTLEVRAQIPVTPRPLVYAQNAVPIATARPILQHNINITPRPVAYSQIVLEQQKSVPVYQQKPIVVQSYRPQPVVYKQDVVQTYSTPRPIVYQQPAVSLKPVFYQKEIVTPAPILLQKVIATSKQPIIYQQEIVTPRPIIYKQDITPVVTEKPLVYQHIVQEIAQPQQVAFGQRVQPITPVVYEQKVIQPAVQVTPKPVVYQQTYVQPQPVVYKQEIVTPKPVVYQQQYVTPKPVVYQQEVVTPKPVVYQQQYVTPKPVVYQQQQYVTPKPVVYQQEIVTPKPVVYQQQYVTPKPVVYQQQQYVTAKPVAYQQEIVTPKPVVYQQQVLVTPKPVVYQQQYVTPKPVVYQQQYITPKPVVYQTVTAKPAVTPKAVLYQQVFNLPQPAPISVQPKPVVYQQQYVTPKPVVYQQEIVTPKPVVYQQQYVTPKPVVYQQQYVTPKPVVYQQEIVTPKPVVYQQQYVTPKPVVYQQEIVTPKPVVYQQQYVTPKPVVYQQESVTPKPVVYQQEIVTPKPVVYQQQQYVTPKPVVYQQEIVTPKPVVYQQEIVTPKPVVYRQQYVTPKPVVYQQQYVTPKPVVYQQQYVTPKSVIYQQEIVTPKPVVYQQQEIVTPKPVVYQQQYVKTVQQPVVYQKEVVQPQYYEQEVQQPVLIQPRPVKKLRPVSYAVPTARPIVVQEVNTPKSYAYQQNLELQPLYQQEILKVKSRPVAYVQTTPRPTFIQTVTKVVPTVSYEQEYTPIYQTPKIALVQTTPKTVYAESYERVTPGVAVIQKQYVSTEAPVVVQQVRQKVYSGNEYLPPQVEVTQAPVAFTKYAINNNIKIAPPSEEYVLNIPTTSEQPISTLAARTRSRVRVTTTEASREYLTPVEPTKRTRGRGKATIVSIGQVDKAEVDDQNLEGVLDKYSGKLGPITDEERDRFVTKVIKGDAKGFIKLGREPEVSTVGYEITTQRGRSRGRAGSRKQGSSSTTTTEDYDASSVSPDDDVDNGDISLATLDLKNLKLKKDKKTVIVVSQVSDANPLLIGKLASTCSCESNNVKIGGRSRRPNGRKSLDNDDDQNGGNGRNDDNDENPENGNGDRDGKVPSEADTRRRNGPKSSNDRSRPSGRGRNNNSPRGRNPAKSIDLGSNNENGPVDSDLENNTPVYNGALFGARGSPNQDEDNSPPVLIGENSPRRGFRGRRPNADDSVTVNAAPDSDATGADGRIPQGGQYNVEIINDDTPVVVTSTTTILPEVSPSILVPIAPGRSRVRTTTEAILLPAKPAGRRIPSRSKARVPFVQETSPLFSPITAEEIASTVDYQSVGPKKNVISGEPSKVRAGAAFDRYGPGGWRGADETLQGSVDCKRPGLFRHPKYCNKFYSCNYDSWKKRYTLSVFNCPVHLAYDEAIGACNWPSKGPACVDDNLIV